MAVAQVLDVEVAWVADNDRAASAVLAHRHPNIPNLGDIAAVDWARVPPVDVLIAGFPCQDVSTAGARAGLRAGTRTGVWTHVARAICVLRPSLVFLENVRGILSAGADSRVEQCPWCVGDSADEPAVRASGAVLGDLADLGFDAEWTTVPAAAAGAPHRRERWFCLAWPAADSDCEPAQRRGVAGVLGGPQQAAAGVLVEREAPARQQQRDGHPFDDRGEAAAAHADISGRERSKPASGRLVPARGATAHAEGDGQQRDRSAWGRRQRSANHDCPTAEPVGTIGLPDAAVSGDEPVFEWGVYEHAVRRWEHLLRPAPWPVQPGRAGPVLSLMFVEWVMGLPEGWVTDVPELSRNAQLRLLGNGVVPQQGAYALRLLLTASAPDRRPAGWAACC